MTITPAPEQGSAETPLETIRRQAATIEKMENARHEPIAIIGVGLRFPGDNNNLEDFEAFLRAGGDGIRPLPPERFDLAAFAPLDDADRGKIRTAGCGFIDGIDLFDAPFFNISPLEAQYIDPQQRLLLETTWECLEDANIDPASLRHGNSGVYLGTSSIDYALELDSLPYEELDGHLASGITGFPMPGRLSYFFGLHGPSLTTDAACASSLTALHLAVDALRTGETDLALCGAVNSIHHPKILVMFSNGNMLAADGHCKTFDDAADGYARAEGCAMMVLKRQSDAERDGDTILALVRGTAIGQDGESAGLTVPNGTAQETVMRAALGNALMEPGDIQYVEAHGTGTPLGDPIEMGAITDVFADSHSKDTPITVGSVKTNLGHMEPAAGMAGLLKTLLQLRAGTVFPHINFNNPSGRIPWDSIPVEIPTECRPWESPTRRAVINSFGFAGSIASVVIEQAPQHALPDAAPADPSVLERGHVFTLSAKSATSKQAQIERYQRFLAEHPETDLADLCYTGNVARTHFPGHRLAGVVHDRAELDLLLEKHAADSGRPAGGGAAGPRKVAFLFAGQGSQYPGMGAPLYRQYPVFRRWIDECDRLFAPLLDRSVKAMILGEAEDALELQQTRYTQPALFALEYALAQLWLSFGVRPNVLIGHSIGEVAAAAVAGLFDLPDAVALVAARGRLMQSVTAPGGMAAVDSPAQEIAPLLADYPDLAIAAINSPRQCVVSGGEQSLAAVTALLTEQGRSVKQLAVSHAFHSPLMHEVFDDFRAALATVKFREPSLTLVSNLTGAVARYAEISDPEYWIRHIGEPVDFEAGMRTVEKRGKHAFLEIGPSRTLSSLAKRCVDADEHLWLDSLDPRDEHGAALTASVARLYTAGLPFSWPGFHSGHPGHKISLPTYAFDRKRYWLPLKGRHGLGGPTGAAGAATHPLLGEEVSTASQREAGVREFRAAITTDSPGHLADHVAMGRVVFPGTGYLETLLALLDAVYGETRRPIEDLRILEPLFLDPDETTELRTRLTPGPGGTATAEVVSRIPGADGPIERRHATAVLGGHPQAYDEPSEAGRELIEAARTAGEPDRILGADEVYAAYSAAGLEYGPEYTRMRSVAAHGADFAIGDLRGRSAGPLEHVSPALLDAAGHAFAALAGDSGESYLPVRFGWFRLFKKPKSDNLRVLLRVVGPDVPGVDVCLDLIVLEDGRPVFELRGFGCKRVAAAARPGFYSRPVWLKRSPTGQPPREARHLLAVVHPGADRSLLAAQAADTGLRLTFATTTDEASQALRAGRVTDVCWLWRPGRTGDAVGADTLREDSEENYRDLLDLLKALAEEGFGRDQRLWLVTERGQWLPGDRAGTGECLAASSLWGFGHTLLNEYPAYRVTLFDLPGAAAGYAPLLAEVLAPEADEFQIAHRDGQRYVKRLLPADPSGAAGPGRDGDFELVVREYGQFSGIKAVPLEAVEPRGDEIRVDVRAAGLNFKDVLNALGMLKEFGGDQPLGFEAAGTVAAAGPEAGHRVGDEVIVNYLGCMKSSLTVPSAMAVRKPAGIGFVEAAGLASVYVTAYYALHRLAGMKAGDKVLIHAAAGGVGQAAVHLAKAAGAEVYATASPHKWPLLKRQGVQHVMNSRTLDFADEILELTGGAGVDIVLNSLNKDYIPAGLRSLAAGGRFIEMGKVGAWTPEQVRNQRPDVTYHNFDLSELPEAEMFRLNTEIMGVIVGMVEDGTVPPIVATAYSLDEIEEAFKVLSRGANIGKLVFDFASERPAAPNEAPVDAEHSYLISGGLGALGLITAGKLADLGARHLVLVGRHETVAPDLAPLLERLAGRAEVTVLAGDIADAADLRRIVAAVEHDGHPVGGIVHSAGAVSDAPVSAQTWENIDAVLRPKIYGSWLLHEAAAALPQLRFFVGYSSAASVIGAPAQSNYAAGNAFLDHLMLWRASQGLPALSVNWGPWGEVGMSARLGDQLIRRWQDEGVSLLTPAKGARALAGLLGGPLAQMVVGECDWSMFAAARPLPNALYKRIGRDTASGARGLDLDALLAATPKDRIASIDEFVRARVAAVLHYENADAVDSQTEFVRLGLDSLVAVELKNSLESAFRLPLPASVAYDYPSAGLLAEYLDAQLVPEPAA